MNYRHAYHAGNFADVFKHIVLVALTKAFLRKDTAFCYLDTHAGVGYYDLAAEAAQKSKEYAGGVSKILAAPTPPALITDYLNCLKPHKKVPAASFYPGSPFIVKHFLRPDDRMILSELHPEDYQQLKKVFSQDKQVAVHHLDGYQSLKAFLPPKQKRGFVLIDPPYEQTGEFEQLLKEIPAALNRWETGVYAIWYPIKNRTAEERFLRSLRDKINRPMLIAELSIYPENLAINLNGSGMVIINPPWQLEQELQAILPWLWQVLSVDKQGQYKLKSFPA